MQSRDSEKCGSLSALRAGKRGMATPGFPPPVSNNGSMRGIVGTVENLDQSQKSEIKSVCQ